MNIAKELDLAIKLKETGKTAEGFIINEKLYDTYMTEDEWNALLNSMSEQSREEYGAGGGSELSPKGGKPPKMASYGSSSRMIYMLSRHLSNFHYEKKFGTTVGGVANLDGFIEKENGYVFVEAKCHEPYSHKNNTVSQSYRELYEYLNEYMAGMLEIKMTDCKKAGYMDVEFAVEGEKLEYFDLKQMICHLLGIATEMLKGKLEQKQINFIYLLYDPTDLIISESAKETIDEIYERCCYECNILDFATLFGAILTFLKNKKYHDSMNDSEIESAVWSFTFTLASQDFYPLLI